MQSKLLIIIATISVILGGAIALIALIALGFGSAEAQPTGAKQIQFVFTGAGEVKGSPLFREGVHVERFEDPEYGTVCYVLPGPALSCLKK